MTAHSGELNRAARSRVRVSLGGAHEFGLASAAFLALLMVLLGNRLPLVTWLVLVAPPLSAFLHQRNIATPALSGTALSVAAVGLGGAMVVQRGLENATLGATVALLGLLAARLMVRKTLVHDVQALLLSLLCIMAASVLNQSLSYAVIFPFYAVAVVWSLTTRQLLLGAQQVAQEQSRVDHGTRQRRDIVTPQFFALTAVVALTVLASTTVVFLAFPRVGLGKLGLRSGGSGRFPGAVSLNGSMVAAGSNEVVARVSGVSDDEFSKGLYLRGAVFEEVSGSGFSKRKPSPPVPYRSLALAMAPRQTRYQVQLEPVAESLLFTLGEPVSVKAVRGGTTNPNFRVPVDGMNRRGELQADKPLQTPFVYEVIGGIAATGYLPAGDAALSVPQADLQFFLELPEDLNPQIAALAHRITKNATTDVEKAGAIRNFLLKGFTYTLSQPNGGKASPLYAFLLDDRRGHCEYFASAFALLLRVEDIPARVIGGYQGGKYNEVAHQVVFRGKNAHAWVEWFAKKKGWIIDDATPAASARHFHLSALETLHESLVAFWNNNILDYALTDQMRLLSTASSFHLAFDKRNALALVLGILGLLLLGVLIRRRRERFGSAKDATRLGQAILQTVERLGGTSVPPEWTLREAAMALPSPPRRLIEVVAAWERQRYGEISLDDKRVDAAIAALNALPMGRPPMGHPPMGHPPLGQTKGPSDLSTKQASS